MQKYKHLNHAVQGLNLGIFMMVYTPWVDQGCHSVSTAVQDSVLSSRLDMGHLPRTY